MPRIHSVLALATLASAVFLIGASRKAHADGPELYAGIELGAKGIKAIALPVEVGGTPDLNHLVTKLPHVAINDVTLGARTADGSFRPEAIAEARAAVGDFYTYFRETLKIPPERIWVVASSGLLIGGTPPNYPDLKAAVKAATGGAEDLNQVDQETEVGLLVHGAIPRGDLGKAVLVDIGSGNVKLGYHTPRRGLSVARDYSVNAPIEGTVAYVRTIRAEVDRLKTRGWGAFCEAAARLRRPNVELKVAEAFPRMAGLENRSRIYLSGGVVWAIATLTNPGGVVSEDPVIPMNLADVRRFNRELQDRGEIPRPDLTKLAEGARDRAGEEVQSVLDKFTTEDLLAGSEILLAIADALHWESLNKEVYFTRSGIVAWIVGFVNKAR